MQNKTMSTLIIPVVSYCINAIENMSTKCGSRGKAQTRTVNNHVQGQMRRVLVAQQEIRKYQLIDRLDLNSQSTL